MTTPLASLRAHLLGSGLGIKPDAIHLRIENGTAMSYPAEANRHFEMSYQISLLVQESTLPLNSLVFVLLRWVEEHYREHPAEALSFQVEPINENAADLLLTIPFREIVRADGQTDGTSLAPLAVATIEEDGPATATVSGTHQPKT